MDQNLFIFQMIYAEATAIPYDASAIGRCRAALYRLANWYGIDVPGLRAELKAKRNTLRKSAKVLLEQDEIHQAVATMGTVGTCIGWMASHVHAPLDDTNLPQLRTDIYSFLGMLSVLEKLPTAKAA